MFEKFLERIQGVCVDIKSNFSNNKKINLKINGNVNNSSIAGRDINKTTYLNSSSNPQFEEEAWDSLLEIFKENGVAWTIEQITDPRARNFQPDAGQLKAITQIFEKVNPHPVLAKEFVNIKKQAIASLKQFVEIHDKDAFKIEWAALGEKLERLRNEK
jgi:hypothetical protein